MQDFLDRPTDFSELLLRLYRLSSELPITHFQDAALTQIKRVLPFDSARWGTGTETDRGIDIHIDHLHEQPQEVIGAYEAIKHQDSATATLFGKPRAVGAFHSATCFKRPDQKDAFEYAHRFRMVNAFIAIESQRRLNFVQWISLYRADGDAHCTEDECCRLSQLAPHIMQALALNRVMHLNHLTEADRALSPHGTALADMRGVIYHADPQFRALVLAEWNDSPGFKLPADLMECLHQGSERFIGRAMVVRGHAEHGLLFLKARPKCRADQLSPREWTIARRIVQGESYKQIAQAVGRSPATVRAQIRAIHEKLQVTSVATLIEAMRLAE